MENLQSTRKKQPSSGLSDQQTPPNEEDIYPIFPPEIECKIFVAAFDGDQEMKSIGTLLRVSKRTYQWLLHSLEAPTR